MDSRSAFYQAEAFLGWRQKQPGGDTDALFAVWAESKDFGPRDRWTILEALANVEVPPRRSGLSHISRAVGS